MLCLSIYATHSRELTHTLQLVLISMCVNFGGEQADLEASSCSREKTTLLLPLLRCEDRLLLGLSSLYRYKPPRVRSNDTISKYFQLPLMDEGKGPTFRNCPRECLREPDVLAAQQHLEKPVGLFTARPESLCTC